MSYSITSCVSSRGYNPLKIIVVEQSNVAQGFENGYF